MPNKVWGKITDLFQNFNGDTVEVWEWISDLTHLTQFNPCHIMLSHIVFIMQQVH